MAERYRQGLTQTAVDHQSLRQDLGEHAFVHRELGQRELELVHVTVVPDLLGARHRFQSRCQIDGISG